tara:strand:- start:771 stop:1229 length:459 start_codon:yes stop_codon:yes gene_type:complete
MARTYIYECKEDGDFTLECDTVTEFEEITTSSSDGYLLECPQCEKLCPQNYAAKTINIYDSPEKYRGLQNRREVEENWMRKECEVTREAIHSNESGQASPYSTMDVNYDYYRNKYGSAAIADNKTVQAREKTIKDINSKHRHKVGDQVSKSK